MSAYVYTYWADRTPLYVGVTINVLRRAKQHLGRPWANAATHITVTEYVNRGEAYAAEVDLIGRLLPVHNKTHNPRFNKFLDQRELTEEELLEGDRQCAEVMDRILGPILDRLEESA